MNCPHCHNEVQESWAALGGRLDSDDGNTRVSLRWMLCSDEACGRPIVGLEAWERERGEMFRTSKSLVFPAGGEPAPAVPLTSSVPLA